MNLELKGKVVLITGSGQGLGKGIAKGFLEEGSDVILTDIDKDKLNETTHDFNQLFPNVKIFSFVGDLTKESEIIGCIESAIIFFGRIDILIANLGSGQSVSGWDPSEEEWERMMDMNFNGARRITKAVVPFMIENKSGSLIYISSIAGKEVIGAPVTYSVIKAGLIAYSKNLSFKLADYHIRVNTICPGNMYFVNGTWEKKMKDDPTKVNSMINEKVPLRRFTTPEEIAHLVLFLASDKASFITGSCIIVDGGQTVSI